MTDTDVLIVGSGPFGLSLAAYLGDLGVDYVLAGEPMSFWRDHMPNGMLLRSGLDWHLDVQGEATLTAFIAESGLDEGAVMPLSRDRYIEYMAWFMRRKEVRTSDLRVERIASTGEGFVAEGHGGTVSARSMVMATGFRDFAFMPNDLISMLPDGRYGHSCEVVDLAAFAGRSVLIVGGRQSAFESAALLVEAGAEAVDLVYRHATPRFEPSDWSWVNGLMARTEQEPAWYRELPETERSDLNARFWEEGRLKLEPWLAPRIDLPNVRLWPNDRVVSVEKAGDDGLHLGLESGTSIRSEFVLLATGYKVDVSNQTLFDEQLRSEVATRNGFPVLDTALQSSVGGLYFTSIAATQDFGPFFAFTVSARCSARLIGDSVSRRQGTIKP